jgi:hypothetical protein
MGCLTLKTLTSKSMRWVGAASMVMGVILTFAANYVDGRAKELNEISQAAINS